MKICINLCSYHHVHHLLSGVCFINAYELFNQRSLKISMLYKSISFNVWVRYFVWNFKWYLCNSTQIYYPYIERCGFYSHVKIWELLDLRTHKCFDTPQGPFNLLPQVTWERSEPMRKHKRHYVCTPFLVDWDRFRMILYLYSICSKMSNIQALTKSLR